MDVFSDVANLAHKHLRSVISTKSMDEIFSGYLDIERLLHDFLESKAMELGVKIHRVEIRKFK
ncbi:MAG: hypothetical protein QG650_1076 [Patescibacteria group bacterium]|nr:hypothetical protein [Patescibacteria group bacterium]